jgi:hypothetical protein
LGGGDEETGVTESEGGELEIDAIFVSDSCVLFIDVVAEILFDFEPEGEDNPEDFVGVEGVRVVANVQVWLVLFEVVLGEVRCAQMDADEVGTHVKAVVQEEPDCLDRVLEEVRQFGQEICGDLCEDLRGILHVDLECVGWFSCVFLLLNAENIFTEIAYFSL